MEHRPIHLVIVCHGGPQRTTQSGSPAAFKVPGDVFIRFYVEKNNISISYIDTPLNICGGIIPVKDVYDPGAPCPNYDLVTFQGETGGIYECSKLAIDVKPKPTYSLHYGLKLSSVIKKLKRFYPDNPIILHCYFCRANERLAGRAVVEGDEDPLMSIAFDMGADEDANFLNGITFGGSKYKKRKSKRKNKFKFTQKKR
jgi:hypothetical protein